MAGYFIGTQLAAVGLPGDVDTVARNQIGSRCQYLDATLGLQEYVYLKGAASLDAGVWVSFIAATYQSVILTANAVGKVAIATGAVLAANWGWFLVDGFYAAASCDSVAAAGGLFIDATPGRVDDDSVAGDFVNGAVSIAASSSNLVGVLLAQPYVTNTVPA